MQNLNGKKRIFLTLAASATALAFCSFVYAADFPQRMEAEKRSAKEGLGQKEISLLQRLPGPGKETVSQKLIGKFRISKTAITTKGTSKREVKTNRLSVVGPDWFLDVSTDGSNVRYRNYGYLEKKKELARPVSQRLSNERLETLGRTFIKETLSEYVKLGKDEEIVPFFTEHAIGGGAEAKQGVSKPEEKVYASTIVFTRRINNVNIIGPGSKIAVMFDNEETPVGFDYDWPQYKMTGKLQKVLPVKDIKDRANKLGAVRQDSPNVKVTRFDCGLYDAGARRHDSKSVIQSACLVSYYETRIVNKEAHERDPKTGHIMSAHVEYIPSGEVIEKDVKWPQAMKMLNQKGRAELLAPVAGPKQK